MIAYSTNKVRLYGDHHVKKLITMIEGEDVAQNLILPNKEQKQFEQEINTMLANEHSKEKQLDFMNLGTRYEQWCGNRLLDTTIKQIKQKALSS